MRLSFGINRERSRHESVVDLSWRCVLGVFRDLPAPHPQRRHEERGATGQERLTPCPSLGRLDEAARRSRARPRDVAAALHDAPLRVIGKRQGRFAHWRDFEHEAGEAVAAGNARPNANEQPGRNRSRWGKFTGRDGAGEGNRTLVFSLEGCCSTIELHPRDRDSMPICAALGNGRADNAFPI
ncbi:MAG: hypothetical protein FD139_1311 [Methylocystaceae bacterium]|nr:MAG: hypothetical protein FD139_1311 [Methylocystaceae bacterium]